MENWKLKYYGELLKKFPNNKYQLAITCLFFFDKELQDYQPFTEYSIDLKGIVEATDLSDSDNSRRRIDLFYKNCNIAIEIDEHHHNEQDDDKREEQIKKVIQDITFYRINIANDQWHQRFLEIKQEILKNDVRGWNESDVVSGFERLQKIDLREIGNQINAIAKYHYGSYATFTSIDRYSGVYINDKKGNIPGNYYIAVVCYAEDIAENEAKVSFVVYSEKVIDNLKDDTAWLKANKPVKSILKHLDLSESYLKSNKEEQFKVLSKFITDSFDIVDDIDPKGLNTEEPT